ncbi:MAG: AAA family ATPase [Prevotella sp.]|nr:AAA family ATPase [Prevotella sp.]
MSTASVHHITADDLFARVAEVLAMLPASDEPTDSFNHQMHTTLVMLCQEALRNEQMAFGNLFAQVDYLTKHFHLSVPDRIAVQRMRRNSNRAVCLTADELRYDCRALSVLIAAVFDVSIPADITCRIPHLAAPPRDYARVDYRYIRCVVDDFDDQFISATIDQDGSSSAVTVDYRAEHLRHLVPLLSRGQQLNLIDCEAPAESSGPEAVASAQKPLLLVPHLIIYEPDYIVDISSIASCFTAIGHHPLAYTLRRLAPSANTQAILLGNFAGRALDDIVNEEPSGSARYSWQQSFRSHFRQQALDYCTCPDLNQDEFKQAAASQACNIRQIVGALFSPPTPSASSPLMPSGTASDAVPSPQSASYSRSAAILEPSFVCEQLGVQGRVDLMTTDFRLLVEQKSGKNFNIASNRPNDYGSFQKEDHYVQLLLYYGVLRQNFHLPVGQIDIRLLYSRYPLPGGLVAVSFYQHLFREAIALRNQIVATDYLAAREGFEALLPQLNAATLNERNVQSRLFTQFLRPQIEAVAGPIHRLTPLERAYFCRMATFAIREQIVSKTGNRQNPTGSNADLWNLTMAEKKDAGSLFTGLTVVGKQKSDEDRGYDIVTLAIPDQGDDFLPKFRVGDPVYLYSYRDGDEPDVRRALLFKAVIVSLSTSELTVSLNDAQKNSELFAVGGSESGTQPEDLTPDDARKRGSERKYAVEPADMGGGSVLRSLAAFTTATADRRALLLGLRPPRVDTALSLSRTYHPHYDDVLLRARQARDYFLLVGPPGTGKTSMALRFLVEEELAAGGTILLTAYTNRAVDEICGMLTSAGLDYLRLGREYSCDARFRDHMLQQMLSSQHLTLSDVRQRIVSVPIIVGTTLTVQSSSNIFSLKHFTLAVVDEASQIVEPALIGLLASPHIDRFILIGDHKQLPAVVQQSEQESAVSDPELRAIGLTNCRNSLFERLLRNHHSTLHTSHSTLHTSHFVGLLRRQGRMHPDIAEWPNRMFYSREQLQPVPLPHQQEPTTEPRLVFLPSQDASHSSYGSYSSYSEKVNPSEARIVAEELKKVFLEYEQRRGGFSPDKTVGVIVPYRNQIATIRRELERLGIPALQRVSIDTVERYQGSQRDVIIYATTVTRPYQLDFLCANTFEEDGHLIDRKLNVAVTRARCRLVVVGHEPTLRQAPLYASLLDHIAAQGSVS